MKIGIRLLLVVSLLFMASCHIRGGEPSESELFSALDDTLDHANDQGGMKINMGNAGAFQTIQFDFKLLDLTKHTCTGINNTYTCKVSTKVSFPPVKDTPEELDMDVIMFDGPGGWRVIDWKMTGRRLVN